ncbi:MAG: ABC transporter ATP-binding protein [Planctomycetes bacterium]|nr:ABC transporter ATP-binding protein [Planctomycetota bacterium]
MAHATIETDRLGKFYGEDEVDAEDALVWAVKDVSLSVFAGEVTVLMGPSGSGKTTLLTMIGGLLDPTEGTLRVCEERLDLMDETQRQHFRRRKVGFIFQNYNLLTSLTAGENVQVALQLRGIEDGDPAELLERVGLGDKVESFPAQLSGGQRQRVAIARALAGEPPVVLADEPTAALDAFQGRRIMDLIRDRAHKDGTTVLVVTHDPRVREFADRVIEMEDGRLRKIVRRMRGSRRPPVDWSALERGSPLALERMRNG